MPNCSCYNENEVYLNTFVRNIHKMFWKSSVSSWWCLFQGTLHDTNRFIWKITKENIPEFSTRCYLTPHHPEQPSRFSWEKAEHKVPSEPQVWGHHQFIWKKSPSLFIHTGPHLYIHDHIHIYIQNTRAHTYWCAFELYISTNFDFSI